MNVLMVNLKTHETYQISHDRVGEWMLGKSIDDWIAVFNNGVMFLSHCSPATHSNIQSCVDHLIEVEK